MAGLVPAILTRGALCPPKRDARHNAGHDRVGKTATIRAFFSDRAQRKTAALGRRFLFTRMSWRLRARLHEVDKAFVLVSPLAHIAEHGEEIVRPEIAGNARHLALRRRLLFQAVERVREELEGRREAHTVFGGELLLRQFLAVEIRHLTRTDDVELQHLEIRLHIVGNPRLREIDEMRFLAIRAAAQLPHDRKTLPGLARAVEIVRQFEEAFEEPRFLVEPVVGQDRPLGGNGRRDAQRNGRRQAGQRGSARQSRRQKCSPIQHGRLCPVRALVIPYSCGTHLFISERPRYSQSGEGPCGARRSDRRFWLSS